MFKQFFKVLSIVVVSILLAFVSSCSNGGEDPATASEIKVGVILPLSGSLLQFGSEAKLGIDQRVKEINDAGGIDGKKITLIYEDNKIGSG